MQPPGTRIEQCGDESAKGQHEEPGRTREPVQDDPDGGPTLFDRLKPVIGQAEGLPPDMAEQHDHYIYGTPKRPPAR